MKKVLLMGLIVLLVPISKISADIIIRSGETVSISGDQKIAGDFYSISSTMDVSGEIIDDLTAIGGRITTNGAIGKDALLAGGSVDIHGPIGDDLRVIGGDIIIAEPVAGDVFVIGGSIRVLSSASVGGDIFVLGGDVDISGPVGGDVVGKVDTLRIDSVVEGGVEVSVTTLTLGDKADVKGSVQYEAAEALTRSPNAIIGGELVRNDLAETSEKFSVKAVIVPLLALLFSVLVWYLIARRFLVTVIDRALLPKPRISLIGLAVLFLAPAGITILTVSVLGTLVGLTALFGYVTLLLLAIICLPALVGQLIINVTKKTKNELTPLTFIVGVFVVVLLMFIPVFGPVVILGFFVITIGAIVDLVLRP